ncbi:helix-turn-helix domain-containing protein [Paraburkholderia kirstenboschensis]|uniref:Helix-turn-helix transcriptional regulator n=1 Tax=Paraburkholderia kirstenboschensis TaxID=1245436 RepID=A0ABZ0EIC7_9BURK|nr:helix-turn-helix transcriptional regulator [Paraburkholderia kirstenboschensis]WOD16966.1 helix-turn-helix transcriptional regulator [Paraburkholderia kirstenboschensis]
MEDHALAARLDKGDKAVPTVSEGLAPGQEIRKLRKARGKPLAELAHAIGRSVSFISQLERGRAEASIGDLKGVANALGVPVGWFFMPDEIPGGELGRIVRAGSRRQLGTVNDGFREELLSPDIGGAFQTLLEHFLARFSAKPCRDA